MTTLSSPRVARMLDRLHRDAEAADGETLKRIAASGETSEEIMTRLLVEEQRDYTAMSRRQAELFLSVSTRCGRFLYAMARACEAKRIVEFGTSMGISTLYLAAALRDNGGGRLIGSELQISKAERARGNVEAAGLADLVEIRDGDALDTLGEVDGHIDLLLLDGALSLYLPVLSLLEPHLPPGAIILGENAFAADYLAHVRDPAKGYVSCPIGLDEGRGNELSLRVG